MKFSLVNGELKEPFKGGKGICPCCNGETIAKCGKVQIHHWAHRDLSECDKWWDSETDWHRKWKNIFPKEWQEVIHFDKVTNEKHIADIKTNKGLVIELQNSPISLDELKSRELFYNKMIWIVNAKEFKKNIKPLVELPKENSKIFENIVFTELAKTFINKLGVNRFYRKKNGDLINGNISYNVIHSVNDIIDSIIEEHENHFQYLWSRPREVWLKSNKRVFLDFNDDYLYELAIYQNNGFPIRCIKKHNKEYFIKRALESYKEKIKPSN